MISKLEMLLALAKEEHFGRAAERLGITQPTLSSGLRQLEDQLGVRLVDRGSRYGGLTPEGERALVWARQIVGDARRLREDMRDTHAGISGHLRLAVIPTALSWAAELVAGFSADHPNVRVTILSRSTADIFGLLANLDADAGVTYLDGDLSGRATALPLYPETYVLLCPPGHPLAQNARLGWGDLGATSLCLLTPDMQNRRIINGNFLRAGIAPPAPVESDSTIALVSMVIHGGLCTILPEALARFLATGHGLSVVPLDAAPAPEVGLVTLQREPFSPVFQALTKAARTFAGR